MLLLLRSQVPQIVLGKEMMEWIIQADTDIMRKIGAVHARSAAFGGTPRHLLYFMKTYAQVGTAFFCMGPAGVGRN